MSRVMLVKLVKLVKSRAYRPLGKISNVGKIGKISNFGVVDSGSDKGNVGYYTIYNENYFSEQQFSYIVRVLPWRA